MPVGAIAGSAVIGGVATVAGADAQKDAARRASDTSLQANRETIAAAERFRADNEANLSPWMSTGSRANALLAELLMGAPPANTNPPTGPAYVPQPVGQPIPAVQRGAGVSSLAASRAGIGPSAFNRAQNRVALEMLGGTPNVRRGGVNALAAGFSAPSTSRAINALSAAQPSAKSAFDTFRDSTGYQFRLNEGMDAINQGYAARGSLQSGAAMKALLGYGQNLASDEFGKYAGMLGALSGRGLDAGRAIAGVGGNTLDMITAANNNSATAAGNSMLYSGGVNANMFGNLSRGFGNALGSAFGSSYAPAGTLKGDVSEMILANPGIF